MSRSTASKAAPRKRKSSRQAVLVMGMHRSGTSALSGILGKLGVQPPRTLMPPTDDNPRGYWESTALMGFHDRLLRSAGSTWSDWDAFNPHWMESSVADTFRDRLPEVLEHEFGDAPLFLVKDPRISRFARFWLEALPALSIAPKVVICVRHPWEVAQSLEVRNDFGRKRAQLIWLRHMLDAEYATRGVTRAFVHYGALLQNWAAQVRRLGKELDIPWPRWSSEVELEIDHFLTSSLHRNIAESSPVEEGSELDTWLATSYRAFVKLAEGGKPPVELLAQLDAVRCSFDETSAIYGSVVREQELKAAERLGALGQDLARETEQAGALRERLEEATQALDSARSTIEVREGEIASWAEANRSGEAERVRMHDEYQATVTGLVERLKEREAELQALSGTHATATAALAEREGELQRLRDEHATATAALAEREGELQRLRDEHATATAAVAERDGELQRQREELAAAKATSEETLQGLRAELQALRDAHAATESALAERDGQLTELRAARDAEAEQHASALSAERQAQAEAVARLSASHSRALGRLRDAHANALGKRDRAREALESTLDERFHELAHLSRLLLGQESQVDALKARLSEAEAAHEAARSKHEQALAELGAQHSAALQTRDAEHVAALQTRDAEHAAALQARDAEHAAALQARDAAHQEALTRTLEQLRAEHEQALASQRQTSETRLKDTVASHQRKTAELLAEHAVVTSALEKAAEEKQQELEHLQQRMDKAVAARDSRYEQQTRKHAQALSRVEKVAAEQKTLVDALVRELQTHRDDIRRVSAELHATRNSRSWQLATRLRSGGRKPAPLAIEALPVQEQARLIRESGRFDVAWYLSRNPDVVANGMDPVLHYLEHGAREGRRPAPDFDAAEYARRHGLEGNPVNPLLHHVATAGAANGASEPGAVGEEPR